MNTPFDNATEKTADTNLTAGASRSAAAWRILFAGGDPLWFAETKRDISGLHPEWTCVRAADISKIQPPDWQAADAFIVEGRATGARDWLEELRAERENLICLVRCDMADHGTLERWKGTGHPIASTHNDASLLVSSLLRTARLQQWAADPAMKRLLPQIRKLPTTPKFYDELTVELRSEECSLENVAALLRQDPVMSAKILQLANSAFFASRREVTDMLDAAMILGSERIKSLVLLAGVFSQYGAAKDAGYNIDSIVTHSLQVGAYARTIVLNETKDLRLAEAAFTAGVLHDVGKMILAGNLPQQCKEMRNVRLTRKIPDHEAEREIFGATHATIGACLLASWGLPLSILEAVAWHHEPEQAGDSGFSPLAAVHAANAFAHQTDGTPSQSNTEYLERCGAGKGAARWRQMFDN